MTTHTYSLHYERTVPVSEASPPLRLQREIWDAVLSFCSHFPATDREVWSYMRDVTQRSQRDEWFTEEDGILSFHFHSEGDKRRRSAALAYHWMSLAVAARWKTLEGVAGHNGAALVDIPPRLSAVLDEPELIFVTAGDHVWFVTGTEPGDAELVSDAEVVSPDSLPPEVGRDVEQVLEERRCLCPLCSRLRPDPQWENAWLNSLKKGSPSQVENAAWFLLNSVSPSHGAILGLARATSSMNAYRHNRAMFELGKRLEVRRLNNLRDAVDGAAEPMERASLVACMAGMSIDPQTRVEVLVEQFDTDPVVAATAVEFLGYGEVPERLLPDLAERLSGLVGRADDLDYAVALTLYNVFREESSPPRSVRQALERLTRSTGEGADVAARALEWFDDR